MLSQVRWIPFQDVKDDRGRLTAIEAGQHTPFPIERVFTVHQVVPGTGRGGHAHRDTDQVACAAYGSLKVDLSDGVNVVTYVLDDPGKGLLLPRMTWTRMYDFSEGAVFLVFASTHYDRNRSLRSWADYISARREQEGPDWNPLSSAPGEEIQP